MLRITKGITIASMVAVFVLAPVVSAQAADDVDVTVIQCDGGYPPAEPRVNPDPPIAGAKDVSQDPYAQGNAPIGGGRNCDSGPGAFSNIAPSQTYVFIQEGNSAEMANGAAFDRVMNVMSILLWLAVLIVSVWTLATDRERNRKKFLL